MLLITRPEGRSVYIGRDVVLTVLAVHENGATDVHVATSAGVPTAVSGPGVTMSEHVERQFMRESLAPSAEERRVVVSLMPGEAVRIGRGVSVKLSGVGDSGARLEVEAPRHMAVTRDDFTFTRHLEFQREREAARGA